LNFLKILENVKEKIKEANLFVQSKIETRGLNLPLLPAIIED